MFSINPVLILHITTANKFILSFSGPFPVAQWTRVKKNTPGITELARSTYRSIVNVDMNTEIGTHYVHGFGLWFRGSSRQLGTPVLGLRTFQLRIPFKN